MNQARIRVYGLKATILKAHLILLSLDVLLFSGVIQPTSLKLIDSTIYSNSFMLLHYRVNH